MPQFKTGVPIPPASSGRPGIGHVGKHRQAINDCGLENLQRDQSVHFSNEELNSLGFIDRKTRAKFTTAIYMWAKSKRWKITMRQTPEGLGIWRIT